MGEDNEETADSYFKMGDTQNILNDYILVTESDKRALIIRQKVLDEDHEKTFDSHFTLGATQCMLSDYSSATESHKRALNITS